MNCNKIRCHDVDRMTEKKINQTLDSCESCERYSLCDTVCYMNDKLKLINGEAYICSKCDEILPCDCSEIYFDTDENPYCYDCWIEHEVKLKGLTK